MRPAGGRIDTAEAFQEAFGVSRETLDRLATYEALLKTWQRTINLVSPATLGEVWHRHFADSAQLLALGLAPPPSFPPPSRSPPQGGGEIEDAADAQGGKRWLDLGSGGGFPGLVLAIMLAERDPEARMTLIESDSRKAAFLAEVARKTGVAVEIRAERSENAATQAKSRINSVITARALAPLPKLLGLVQPFFSPQTVGLFPKGREAEVEVEEAKKRFDFDSALAPSLTDAQARIVIVRNLAARTEG
ncbi:16S rRNA (guanine(527)-N(7))-methyltransferase RsmG [Hyphomicrobium sp.]|uniref:16S rRNA (guanine(527)-N(7))-methyltransferase RsmG n=1 Tax=Hyphomicrobium sp. TaxID=82 RepID=UPI0025B8FD7F|nr:16S rRNA (guanine(527)-N(7))-methyltransferase RsmG [Hyphomicrobium sp.]MCC7253522.1 16S rRNA (guanine(527)-N(7))-methyltransferase RsmG [Hyphomicrobium sp.]